LERRNASAYEVLLCRTTRSTSHFDEKGVNKKMIDDVITTDPNGDEEEKEEEKEEESAE